jgi:hypothetical protein
MALTVEDLRAKGFEVDINGVKLQCNPLRLSHALGISKLGEVFQNPKDATKKQIKEAEDDLDEVLNDLIPELKDKNIQLDMSTILKLLSQLMEQIEPSDNKELAKRKVSIDSDPKVETTG